MCADKKASKLIHLNQQLQVEENELRALRLRERIAVFVLFGIFLLSMAVSDALTGAFITLAIAIPVVAVLYWLRRPHEARIKQLRREITSTRRR